MRLPKDEDVKCLFNALKHGYKIFLNVNKPSSGGRSMNCTLEELLKLHDVKNVKAVSKFMMEKKIFEKDPDRSKAKDSWIYYSTPHRPTKQLAYDIILAVKHIDRGDPVGKDWHNGRKTVNDVKEDINDIATAMNTDEVIVDKDGNEYQVPTIKDRPIIQTVQPDLEKEILRGQKDLLSNLIYEAQANFDEWQGIFAEAKNKMNQADVQRKAAASIVGFLKSKEIK